LLELYPVSERVNNVRNDGPDLVEPIAPDEVAEGPGAPTRDPAEPGLFDHLEETDESDPAE
jgi:hypothetical protein